MLKLIVFIQIEYKNEDKKIRRDNYSTRHL